MLGKRRVYCLIIVFLALFSVASPSWANTELKQAERFVDVTDDHWAKNEIDFLANEQIINGYLVGQTSEFRPARPVTRAEAAKMIVSALRQTEWEDENLPFEDIPEKHWARGWIARAVQLGVMGGDGTANFRPNDSLSRAEMSIILVNAFSLASKGAAVEEAAIFEDTEGHWALRHINRLYYHGIANGRDGKFFPKDAISRAEFATLLARTMNDQFRLPEPDLIEQGKTNVQGIVTASLLNVRQSPSTTSAVVGKLSKGQVVNVYDINGYWAKIAYNDQFAYVYKVYLKLQNISGSPIDGRIIVVDAGHGGKDPGSLSNGANEKDVVLEVAKLLKGKLEKAGATVVMTRETDVYPTLQDRVDIAKNNYAEMFVSIHTNSATNTSAKGAEVYYDSSTNPNAEESKKLAQYIQEEIVRMANMVDRGVKNSGLYVLRNNSVTSVLVELGFISNAEDRAKLTSAEYQNIYAEAIYQGIVKYYTSQ
ncbi:N-acetylmuramoyl-L-alanine amidase [Anoxybacillus sp. LAT_35]|uniref:N-acetylmuramoyl-L-alanine amidase n=1 Tax=Anoxybacillus TaxID=150247 RepID=UPI001EDB7BEF|nr:MULTISPECIES: N-acetylmuramoyl-L-alanine amidase [Anoxybacillus]MCG5026669.1 N-acetylmuramoyl-L-alanine amidase [Anoxybacillus flavithermus]MCG6196921.1 N-acetylmuramoyl-L-alanine amidase [Anoxybacillus sp. LAT_38]MCG3084499.1 N-acetylmuramoyl-L-alanine amidase [Anoxybacillus sp. LAT27]MCG6171243.1 N-acetylmuramoyl-L-alanine amidase [Anoxybacillus sp. LAT_11]MCG6176395.1 N-acetylmuramoyl-L-alanine amidase [Anoxybacillus sp. LAT_31]